MIVAQNDGARDSLLADRGLKSAIAAPVHLRPALATVAMRAAEHMPVALGQCQNMWCPEVKTRSIGRSERTNPHRVCQHSRMPSLSISTARAKTRRMNN